LRTISEVSELVRTGEVSPVELVRECLEKIDALNPRLNAFSMVAADSALEEARQAETDIQSGNWRGPLHGIPIGLKDLIDTAGVRTTAASAVFENRVPEEDAEVVRKLQAAGAVIIGKHNLHEFAYGGSSLISHFGPVRNPVNPEHIAGGSSGGSAAAVVSGMCYAAIGTDTAGSVREPAALCGAVGLKPSYGLVSTEGIIPLSPSLDHAGPITRSAGDCTLVLDAITGSGALYSECLGRTNNNWRIGIPRAFFFEEIDSEVATAVESAISDLQHLGCTVVDIEIRVDTDRTLQSAEAYAFHRDMIAAFSELYNPQTLRRLRSGENISNDQYKSSLRELAHMREEVATIFQSVDLLVTPTTPIPAPRMLDLTRNPDLLRPAELVLLRNTRPVNVWGLPAISVPCGFTSTGLPIGLQIVGPSQREDRVLQLAFVYEKLQRQKYLPA